MRRVVAVVLLTLLPGTALPQAPAKTISPPAWVARSDAHAKPILEVLARFSPEGASFLGVEGFDEEILDLGPQLHERTLAAQRALLKTLEAQSAAEAEAPVQQDLQILVKAVQENIEGEELNHARRPGRARAPTEGARTPPALRRARAGTHAAHRAGPGPPA
jgi:hypothetical protein